MPRIKSGISDRSEPDPNDVGYDGYNGPMPPVANYRCTLKWLRLTLDKNGDTRWNGPCEISEDSKPGKKYNGYTIWVGQSFTDHPRSKAYMMSLATALGATWTDILDRVIADKAEFDKANPATVTKIGRVKIDNNELIVVAKAGKDVNGDPRLEPASFLPADWEPEEDDEDEDEDELEDDDIEEDEDEDEDEEEDEEPAPRARAAKRRAPVDVEDEDDFEDDEDDEEEEPEPAPRARKSSARKSTSAKKSAPAKKASTRKRRAVADDDEVPF